jgi:hypothetical protein
MLYMVIERFRNPDLKAVGERFTTQGRMLPPGVNYITSWMECTGERCFQIMESPTREALNLWIKRWDDLVDFEVTAIQTSQEFWAARA